MAADHFLGWNLSAFRGDEHVIVSSYLLILTLLLLLGLTIQHVLTNIWKCTWIPNAGANIVLGMIIGFIIRVAGGYDKPSIPFTEGTVEPFNPTLLGFSPFVFYFGFLPLIIFESGYHLKRLVFYHNFSAIVSLALLGTSISIVIVSTGLYFLGHYEILGFNNSLSFMECISFGALISSTDPVTTLATFSSLKVDPAVYYLVFGESVLNDALALTVFTVSSHYIGQELSAYLLVDCVVKTAISFICSGALGYALGILCAYFIRKLQAYNNKIYIVGIYLTLIYIPFFLSECFQLSGIVTVLLAGVAARKYTNKSISPGAALAVSFVLKAFTSIADLCCACLLGMSVFSQSPRNFHVGFITFTLLLITIARAVHVYPILNAVRTTYLRVPITNITYYVMSYCVLSFYI